MKMIEINEIKKLVDSFKEYIFCEYYQEDKKCLEIKLKKIISNLGLPEVIINEFSELERILKIDFISYLKNDPSIDDEREVLYCYPGFNATICYRLAHLLKEHKVKLIPRIITELAHSKTGIDIHPASIIGEGLFIDHGTGVVIGETAIIGKNVKIYHGVTLGAFSTKKTIPRMDKMSKRHPTIEDDVTLYANATILGGNTIIKKGATIGCNVIVTKTVEEYTKIIK